MKLRNKKTGEIIDSKELLTDKYLIDLFSRDFDYFNSKLHKILEEWEDYEEPKEHWCVDSGGEVEETTYLTENDKTNLRNFGNYFETREEAEKAVEKLKAWKRLKDKGFMFCGTDCIDKNNVIYFEFGERPLNQVEADESEKDLDLLFGDEQ